MKHDFLKKLIRWTAKLFGYKVAFASKFSPGMPKKHVIEFWKDEE